MTVDELIAHYEDAKPGASEAQIARLEESVKTKLPGTYRSFLTARNGGNLDEQLVASFRSKLYADGYGNAVVERIFGVGSKSETAVRPIRTWLSEVAQLPEGVPEQMICIADDFSGNVITLDLRAGSYGQVGLIDHELIGDSFNDPEGYQIIASSFSAFVANLRDADDELPSGTRESEVEASSVRWTGNSNEGTWVMLIGLAVALIALWLLGIF